MMTVKMKIKTTARLGLVAASVSMLTFGFGCTEPSEESGAGNDGDVVTLDCPEDTSRRVNGIEVCVVSNALLIETGFECPDMAFYYEGMDVNVCAAREMQNEELAEIEGFGDPDPGTNSDDSVQACLDACGEGCPAPDFWPCGSDAQYYCNACEITCRGLEVVEDEVCDNAGGYMTTTVEALVESALTAPAPAQIRVSGALYTWEAVPGCAEPPPVETPTQADDYTVWKGTDLMIRGVSGDLIALTVQGEDSLLGYRPPEGFEIEQAVTIEGTAYYIGAFQWCENDPIHHSIHIVVDSIQ